MLSIFDFSSDANYIGTSEFSSLNLFVFAVVFMWLPTVFFLLWNYKRVAQHIKGIYNKYLYYRQKIHDTYNPKEWNEMSVFLLVVINRLVQLVYLIFIPPFIIAAYLIFIMLVINFKLSGSKWVMDIFHTFGTTDKDECTLLELAENFNQAVLLEVLAEDLPQVVTAIINAEGLGVASGSFYATGTLSTYIALVILNITTKCVSDYAVPAYYCVSHIRSAQHRKFPLAAGS